jgi:hypothetical protein
LPKAPLIADNSPWHIRLDVGNQFQTSAMGSDVQRLQRVPKRLVQVKRLSVHSESARFNLGEIKNVVDQGH